MSEDIYSKLSIIIPTFYPGSIISKCIDSLPLNSELIIVDNGEDQELEKLLFKKKNNIQYFKIGDLGLPKSFNYALEKTKNENILITQPDVTFEKDSIKNLIHASIKYKDAGLLAPIIYENNQYSPFNSLDLFLGKNGKLIKKKKVKVRNILPSGDFCVEAVSATAMFLKKSVIKKIGGWDENIYTYLEDLDLCLKLRRNKFSIIKINNALVNHIGFGSHKNENIFKSEMSRNWHFMWSSLYFKHKYNSKTEYLSFLFKNILKYFSKIFLNVIIFKKKKTILNFMRLRACMNYIFVKKSNYRIHF
jgi:N-acetylglucosaminyl-diphospho-decaprenol L-rhamnosyltransferase